MELMKIFGLRHLVQRTPGQVTKKCFVTTVELQWPKICFDHENWFRSKVNPARIIFSIQILNSRGSAIRVFVLLFSFSIFSDRRSLKIESKYNSMKT